MVGPFIDYYFGPRFAVLQCQYASCCRNEVQFIFTVFNSPTTLKCLNDMINAAIAEKLQDNSCQSVVVDRFWPRIPECIGLVTHAFIIHVFNLREMIR